MVIVASAGALLISRSASGRRSRPSSASADLMALLVCHYFRTGPENSIDGHPSVRRSRARRCRSARQVNELARRIDAIENRLDPLDRKSALIDPLALEIGGIARSVKQLSETAAAQKTHADRAAEQAERPQPPVEALDDAAIDKAMNFALADMAGRVPGAPAIAFIRDAIDADRIEIYLQPVVTLPQRKVRHYEALLRLRMPDDRMVTATDFVPFADAGGLMPELDQFMLTRCVRVVRRLQSKNRDVGVFCNLSASTLSDPEAFPRFLEIAEANRAVAPLLMFEMAYPTLAVARGRRERKCLRADRSRLPAVGRPCRRSALRRRRTCRRKYQVSQDRAPVLLGGAIQATAKIHLADLSGSLTRFGIDLIAEKIESESDFVVDLFDFDVKYGQGNLFSPPRPIRPELVAEPDGKQPCGSRPPAEPSVPAPAPGPHHCRPPDGAQPDRPHGLRPTAGPTRLTKAANFR